MENLKIKVNNWDESKEVQELFITLGATCGVEEITSKWVCLYNGQITFYDLLPNVDFKQITLQYLRDLVLLKRNDVGDAQYVDRSDFKIYIDSNDKVYYFEHRQFNNGQYHTWVESCINGHRPESLKDEYVSELKPIKKEGEVKMKEYLELQDDGNYNIILAYRKEGNNWIEIPEGAEEYRSNDKFYKNNGELFYSSYGELTKSSLYSYITLWKRDTTKRENKTKVSLGSNKEEVRMKEYLDKEYRIRKVKQTSGDNLVPSGWIEVPEGAEILYFDKRYKSSNHFFKTVDGKSYYKYLENGSEWIKYDDAWLEDFKENIDNFRIMWQRNHTITPDTSIKNKLKFIEKWLNGEKIQYILGIEQEKTQWHNFTEGAMQYIKRSDIKFREAPKYVTINGIEFKNIEKLVKYVKNNFDLEDGENLI